MRYAIGLSMVGTGALLIFAGIRNQSAWDIVRQAISPGAPTKTQTSTIVQPNSQVTNPESTSDNGRVIRTDYENAV